MLWITAALVHKSLVESSAAPDAVRFRMLETVRRHATASLADVAANRVLARDRLLGWATQLAREYQRLIMDHGHHREAMELADREQHNLRAALDWAADGGSVAEGLVVICRTEDWWRASGHTAEAGGVCIRCSTGRAASRRRMRPWPSPSGWRG